MNERASPFETPLLTLGLLRVRMQTMKASS